MLDVRAIRELFPITRRMLSVAARGEPQPLAYLDHAASTHPPTPVLDAHRCFLEQSYANIHRGNHRLSQIATSQFEGVRDAVRRFISASDDGSTIILLGNTTQALDLAAHVMERVEGVTLVSEMEHHSNDLPHRVRGRVVHFGVHADGRLDYEDLERKLGEQRVKLVAVTAPARTAVGEDLRAAAVEDPDHGPEPIAGLHPRPHRLVGLLAERGPDGRRKGRSGRSRTAAAGQEDDLQRQAAGSGNPRAHVTSTALGSRSHPRTRARVSRSSNRVSSHIGSASSAVRATAGRQWAKNSSHFSAGFHEHAGPAVPSSLFC